MATELITIPELDQLIELEKLSKDQLKKVALLAHPDTDSIDKSAMNINIQSLIDLLEAKTKDELAKSPKLAGMAIIAKDGEMLKKTGIITSSKGLTGGLSGVYEIETTVAISPETHHITGLGNKCYVCTYDEQRKDGFLKYTKETTGKVKFEPQTKITIALRIAKPYERDTFQIAIWELPKI